MTTDADRLRTMYALLNEVVTTSGEPSGAWRALAFSAVQEYRLSRQLVESRKNVCHECKEADQELSVMSLCPSCRPGARKPTALDVAFGALPTPALADGWERTFGTCWAGRTDDVPYVGDSMELVCKEEAEFLRTGRQSERGGIPGACRKHAEEAGAFQVGALPTKEAE